MHSYLPWRKSETEPVAVTYPFLFMSHWTVNGQSVTVPLRDLWSSLVRSGPVPLSRSWWGPREKPGTGSGHYTSSLDEQSRQKSVSDDGLEGNEGVESGAGYTWGFSYFWGISMQHSNKPPNSGPSIRSTSCLVVSPPGDRRTLKASSLCFGSFIRPSHAFSCWVFFINRGMDISGIPSSLHFILSSA